MSILRLYPTGSHYCTATWGQGIGSHTAPNAYSYTDLADCIADCDEPIDAPEETHYAAIFSSYLGGQYDYNPGRFEMTFESAPSGIVITSVSVVGYMRTNSGNNAAIDETPRMKGFVNPVGTRYYQSSPAYVLVTGALGPINRATTGPSGTFARYVCGTWTTNPATAAAWVPGDLAAGTFKAGIECGGVAEGQLYDGLPPTTGGNYASLDLDIICLELSVSSIEQITEPLRRVLSIPLWLKHRRVRTVEMAAAVPLCDVEPAETIYLEDPKFPTGDGQGISSKGIESRPLFPLANAERPSSHVGSLTALDQRDIAVALWSPLHTDVGADDKWSGLAWYDRGGGRTFVRAQGGWIWRPTDNLWRDAASGLFRMTPWGIAICGGSFSGSSANTGEQTWHSIYNTLSAGSGGEGTSLPDTDTTGFTGWTVYLSGDGTVVVKQDTSYLFDLAGYRRAARCSVGSGHASLVQTLTGFSTTQRIRVFLKFRPTQADVIGHWLLIRTTAPTYWDQATSAWVASAVNGPAVGLGIGKASLYRFGDHYEYWSEDFVVGGSGSQNLVLGIGNYYIANKGVDMFAAGIVSTGAASGAAARVIRRDFLATTTAAATQAADILDLTNSETYRIWDASRGTWHLLFTPFYDHEDLADGETKFLLCARHLVATDDKEEVYYERIDATTAAWKVRRTVGGVVKATASFPCSAAAGTLMRYFTPVKLSIRWTSSLGELGLASRTLSIFRNGVKGTDSSADSQSTQEAASFVAIGRTATGAKGTAGEPHTFADGAIAFLQGRLFCQTDDEIAREHALMLLGNALPTNMAT